MSSLLAQLRRGSGLSLLRGICAGPHLNDPSTLRILRRPDVYQGTGKDAEVRVQENAVVRALRAGDLAEGVLRFQRLRNSGSPQVYEALVAAVAEVPDAGAAQAVVNAMRGPTSSAISYALNALCRERQVVVAIALLRRAVEQSIKLHPTMIAAVARALHASDFPGKEAAKKELDRLSTTCKLPHPRIGSLRSFFEPQDLDDCDLWNFAGTPDSNGRSFASLGPIQIAEARLRDAAAKRDIHLVREEWENIVADKDIRHEPRLMASTVSAYLQCERQGILRALDLLVRFVEDAKGTNRENSTNRAAFVCTSACKCLAIAARVAPISALDAYDRLLKAHVPGFLTSIPLTDAYFKVLQYAHLPLTDILPRIEAAREFHLQFDERIFGTALISILRSASQLGDRLKSVKDWLEEIRRSGVSLSTRSYNRFASHLKLESEPEMIILLLKDMAVSGVLPTALTYSIIFESCVQHGRVSSLSQGATLSVIDAIAAHMSACRVAHSEMSQLSFARALAAAGASTRAVEEFAEYIAVVEDKSKSERHIVRAFEEVLTSLANMPCSDVNGPASVFTVFSSMRSRGLLASEVTLEALLQACARLGDEHRAVRMTAELAIQNENIWLTEKALEHLLFALAKECSEESWAGCVAIIRRSVHYDFSPLTQTAVRKLALAYAKGGYTTACEDITSIFGISVPQHGEGRDFSEMRKPTGDIKSFSRAGDDVSSLNGAL